ncbi:MAG TPA: SDR family NAD(P)-dependent oxidoreductase [Chloroflexota bacterium]|nr:SDR family NAD(P)-dependent oxidoreductase [Chloroflexota bacterium]
MPFDLSDRVSLVTGASRGTGAAAARILADAGSDLVLLGRDEAALNTVAEVVKSLGRVALIIVDDIARPDASGKAVRAALERYGRLDIVVNNAGINHTGSIEQVDDPAWHGVISTNLTAAYRLCREGFGPMRERGWGRVINIASITAQTGGVSGSVAYSAAKGGLLAMTRTLARDGAPHGITANAVAPGQIDTGMGRALGAEALRRVETAIPLGRLGTPEEVAYAILFLASEEASYITGATLDVNGGLLKR